MLTWTTTPTGTNITRLATGERRKLGMPRIDKNLYARENGWAISGLAAYYDVTNDAKALAIAERGRKMGDRPPRAAEWRIPPWRKGSRRAVPRRYAGDGAGLPRSLRRHRQPRLADVSGQGRRFRHKFPDEAGGFVTSKTSEGKTGVLAKPAKLMDDQVQVASS
jgi:Highly conserved protein containing a thioredoxin domain